MYEGLRGGSDVPQDARGDVATAANGDHESGLELIEDLFCGFLAELVHLWGEGTSVLPC